MDTETSRGPVPEVDYSTTEIASIAISEPRPEELEIVYPYHRDPGYRPWLRKPGPKKPTPYEEIQAMMARNLSYALIASRVVFVFAIIIAMDFLLPKTPHELTIVGYNQSTGGTIQMELNDGSVINISKKAMRKLKGKTLTILRTRIFDVPYLMTDKENNKASVEISIYGNFLFGPIVLFLTSLTGVLRKKGVEFRFNLGVASAVLAMLNFAFLHIHEF